ncbi:hypothetical protein [Polluticoccus soli]|uniref:hypothetical protein n=1 Tax=Polluticoccus soli TaxID=3034150 RepID=UPI0023E1FB5F|nr:hypothetical protein [Flavipsychrobacter sp. JY13-12]
MKKLLLFIAALPIIFAASCSKDETTSNTAKVRLWQEEENEPEHFGVSVTDFTIAGTKVNVDLMTNKEITLTDNVPFTFNIKKASIFIGEYPDEIYSYSGTVDRAIFTATKNNSNDIQVDIDNVTPTMTINRKPVAVTLTGSTGGGSPYTGIWVRELGASGDETDLAIGNIPGEAANRVWMCEYKGQVGLYKGTISGSTITFDAQYGLPTYTVSKDGDKLMLQGNITGSLATPYSKGSWTAHCGTLGN